MKRLFLSVIIPCFNESENLRRGVLDEVYQFLTDQRFNWELIVSDDGSTDNSRRLVRSWFKGKRGVSLLENKHFSKPAALWEGIKKAKGDFILFSDMDQSTPIKEFLKLQPFLKDYDAIIGSRGLARKRYSLLRKIGSAVFLVLRKTILLKDINDTQCGFKVFKTNVVKKIFPRLQIFQNDKKVKGWKVTSYDVELLFIFEKFGYQIKEVEVEWEDRDVSKGKQRSYLKESKEMLEQIIRVKINDWKGKYGK
jgi:glycosyltransferase involved in cell wall biosynthesis